MKIIKDIKKLLKSRQEINPEIITIPIQKRTGETKEQAVERYNKENNIIDDGSKVFIYIIE